MKLAKRKPLLILLLMAISVSCYKADNRYVNTKIGYEITGPADWHIYRGADGGVRFAKYNTRRYGNSNINVYIESVNNQLQSPQQYINNILLPQMNLVAEANEGSGISSVQGPEIVERNGYTWAKVKYWLPEDSYQVVYVMFLDKYIFIVMLNSTGEQHEEDGLLFQNALDTFKINR